jgi:endonuclease/exonuclease/phosphatase family metal-dependent hydrolase
MRKLFQRVLRLLTYTAFVLLGLLGYIVITEFRPEDYSEVPVEGSAEGFVLNDTLRLLTWNIGYAGLSAEQDFFFDGGSGVRPGRDILTNNLNNIVAALSKDSSDWILLQEVDAGSKRSWYSIQPDSIAQSMPGYCWSFSMNYNSKMVPLPIGNPLGRVVSGLMTLGRAIPERSVRHSLPADAQWPEGIFMLKRCFLAWEYTVKNNQKLILIHLHLSAYDAGEIKASQLEILSKFILNAYQNGDYVIVGGDWNMQAPGEPAVGTKHFKPIEVPEKYPEKGWEWIYPKGFRSNRSLDIPYIRGTNKEYLIDFFLISPNIECIEVEGLDWGFTHSDHNPVRATFVLN